MSRQTQTQRSQQTAQADTFVTGDSGVSFVKGVMHVNGIAQMPDKVERWESSNGLTEYATIAWRDPRSGELRASCNCPGWALKRKGMERRCTHTDDLMGIATCDKRRIAGTILRTEAQRDAVIVAVATRTGIRDLDI